MQLARATWLPLTVLCVCCDYKSSQLTVPHCFHLGQTSSSLSQGCPLFPKNSVRECRALPVIGANKGQTKPGVNLSLRHCLSQGILAQGTEGGQCLTEEGKRRLESRHRAANSHKLPRHESQSTVVIFPSHPFFLFFSIVRVYML